MTTGDGVDSDLVIPDSFGQCLSYEQQIAFILKLIDDIDGGVVIPEITADATVDQSTGTPSVSVVKTGTDEAPVFTFNFHNIKGETGERGEKGETGETGATGRPGNDGADGISPTVTTTAIPNGYRITITDADGSHVFDIYNGNDGETGPAGYSPTVTVQTITGGHSITITDEDGDHTFNVLDGLNGVDGDDGISPEVSITPITGGHRVTIVDVNGSHSFDVMDGVTGATGNGIASTVLNQDYTLTITYTDGTTYTTPSIRGAQGAAGQNGTNGQDGVSPTVSTTAITDGTRVTITDADGSHSFDVMNGTGGQTGPAGPGLPAGGTVGQMIIKSGSADYATQWVNRPFQETFVVGLKRSSGVSTRTADIYLCKTYDGTYFYKLVFRKGSSISIPVADWSLAKYVQTNVTDISSDDSATQLSKLLQKFQIFSSVYPDWNPDFAPQNVSNNWTDVYNHLLLIVSELYTPGQFMLPSFKTFTGLAEWTTPDSNGEYLLNYVKRMNITLRRETSIIFAINLSELPESPSNRMTLVDDFEIILTDSGIAP